MDRYFAYGCNVEPGHMRTLCPSASPRGRAVLADHRLTFPRQCRAWGGGVAGIEPAPGHVVEGVLYDVDATALTALDAYEEVDLGAYRRVRVTLTGPDGERAQAWAYTASPEPGQPFAPSIRYRDALLTGLVAAGASAAYLERVRRLRCA